MKPDSSARALFLAVLTTVFALSPLSTAAADEALLDVLLQNGVITQEQYDELIQKEALTSSDILGTGADEAAAVDAQEIGVEIAMDEDVQAAIDQAVEEKIAAESPVKASYGSSGFRFETRDGNWQTNLQWRAHLLRCLYLLKHLLWPARMRDHLREQLHV